MGILVPWWQAGRRVWREGVWCSSMSGVFPNSLPGLVTLDRLLTHLVVELPPHLQSGILGCSVNDGINSRIKT